MVYLQEGRIYIPLLHPIGGTHLWQNSGNIISCKRKGRHKVFGVFTCAHRSILPSGSSIPLDQMVYLLSY